MRFDRGITYETDVPLLPEGPDSPYGRMPVDYYGNSVRIPVSWGKRRDVSELAGKPTKIRFAMRDCKLYAFQFVSAQGV